MSLYLLLYLCPKTLSWHNGHTNTPGPHQLKGQHGQRAWKALSTFEVRSGEEVAANSQRTTGHDKELALNSKSNRKLPASFKQGIYT